MTEQEAIEELKSYRAQSGTSYPEEIEVAISALEEIQQYREIEKRLEDMYGGQLPLAAYVDVLEYALKEPGKPHPVNARILTYEDADAWEAYKAIGTPEECREAVEKQRAEKPTVSVQEKDLNVGCAVFAAGTKTYWCPSCRKMITGADKHCRTCGKKIDWSEEE